MKLIEIADTFAEDDAGLEVPEEQDGDYSFGDGSTDTAFTFAFWMRRNYGIVGLTRTILAKWDTTGLEREWTVELLDNGGCLGADSLFVTLWDESLGAYIGIEVDSPAVAELAFMTVTYDGSGTTGGLNVYQDGGALASTPFSGGVYVAMEPFEDVPTQLGASYTGGYTFVGYLSLHLIWPDRELDAAEVSDLYDAIGGLGFKSFYSFVRIDEGHIRLAWSGAPGATVSIFRDGELLIGPYVDEAFDKTLDVPMNVSESVAYEVQEGTSDA